MPTTPPMLMPTTHFEDSDDPVWHMLGEDRPPPLSPQHDHNPPQKPDTQDEQQQRPWTSQDEATCPLDIDTVNTKVNELVQALVDAMQQTTEYICQAEEVTRSMVDGLKDYRGSLNKRGDQLEQTWQEMRSYARSIAGHRSPDSQAQNAD